MCAGISGLFAVQASAASLRGQSLIALTYNGGRIVSYSVIGLAVAALGQSFADRIPDLAAPVRLVSGLIIVLVGLQIAFRWRLLAALENTGALL